jgi:hypothetical protein
MFFQLFCKYFNFKKNEMGMRWRWEFEKRRKKQQKTT